MKRSCKKVLVTLSLLGTILFSGFNTQEQEVLPEKINWHSHFLASPDEHSPYFALTATRWQYSYNAHIRGNNLHIDFNFFAGVDPDKSWVKLNKLRGAESKRKLLNHEQGHVNINFLLLKDGEQKVRFQRYTIRNYKKSIKENANKVSAYYTAMQKQYDEETKHGSDDINQKRWDRLIEKELMKYLE
ncbi:DUF922 domain-containing protein [Pedobacter insulae]|uniref:DUF922 domain-containing protein n=1 Tax=Pedobacter insulae TaxID=414048 RepID=A0A1I2UNE0_9SPHI|nr:DUF922 domain-containing protein [Pedobacter insulae]SFG78684.1 protein of unknown function [Pedobacter insulae]